MLTLESEPLAAPRPVLQSRGVVAETLSQADLQDALGERYRLVHELGRGNMGVVYLAWEKALDRYVALKLLSPSLTADQAARDRFVQEARAAARVLHPNIVPIHAVEQAGDFVFFTMGYIEGETLAARIRRDGPLPALEAARILRDAALGVGHVHAQGIIHRDLNPVNIMLEHETGRVVVMDFGVAQVPGGHDLKPGYMAGTFSCTSPEQFQGRSDKRSDIYSLGATGYFMATGRELFDGDTMEAIFEKHLTQPVPSFQAFGEGLDLTYARAVHRCLAKSLADRFANADALAESLNEAPGLRRELPLPLRAFTETMRRVSRTVSPLAVVAVVLLVAFLPTLSKGDWAPAAMAAGSLGVMLAAAIAYLLPVTRRVVRAGFSRADLARAWETDLARQQEELEFATGGGKRFWLTLTVGALALIPLAVLLRQTGLLGSVNAAFIAMVGMFTGVAAGLLGGMRGGRRVDRAGKYWLWFWQSLLGEWVTRVAGVGRRASAVGLRSSGVGSRSSGVGNGQDTPRDTAEPLTESARLEEIGAIGQAFAETARQMVQAHKGRGHLSKSSVASLDVFIKNGDPAVDVAAPQAERARRQLSAAEAAELEELRRTLQRGAGQMGMTEQMRVLKRMAEIVDDRRGK